MKEQEFFLLIRSMFDECVLLLLVADYNILLKCRPVQLKYNELTATKKNVAAVNLRYL